TSTARAAGARSQRIASSCWAMRASPARSPPSSRASSDPPGAVLLDETAVDVDPAVRAQVLDDVPVDRARVRAARGGVRVADREMHGAVDLLVEPDVAHEALDARVAADAELAEPAGAFVRAARLDQELLVRPCARLDDPTAFEHEARTFDLRPVVHGRELAELDHAVRRVLDGRVEDLSARHVDVTVVD